MSFVDFVVLPPGHGRSVTDFWGWVAHEAQLRCPDGVWVVIEEHVVAGGALNLKSTNLPRPWSPRKSSPSRKIPTVEPLRGRKLNHVVLHVQLNASYNKQIFIVFFFPHFSSFYLSFFSFFSILLFLSLLLFFLSGARLFNLVCNRQFCR